MLGRVHYRLVWLKAPFNLGVNTLSRTKVGDTPEEDT